jgi:hypothetical protein
MVVCQKMKKWTYGGIHRITWKALWVFKFFIRYYLEFRFCSCSIDIPILSYGQIFRVSVFVWGVGNFIPAGNLVHYCISNCQIYIRDTSACCRSFCYLSFCYLSACYLSVFYPSVLDPSACDTSVCCPSTCYPSICDTFVC